MAKKKVCANCKFYHDASCSHFWIEKPEQQTCSDFRQDVHEPKPIELVLPKEYTANTEQIIKNQCPYCKHVDFLPFTSQPNCGCDEMKTRSTEWFYAVQKEPKCIFFERINPAYEIFKAINGIDEKE